MTTTSMLLPFYRQILTLGGLFADDDGNISYRVGDISDALLLGGKRLVLPTPEQLRNQKANNTVIFHPLTENIARPEDVVIAKYRQTLNVRLNHTIATALLHLMTLATSKGMQEQCTSEHLDLLRRLADADEKLLNSVKELVRQSKAGSARCFANIYLRRGGQIDGRACYRAAIVTSPFLMELEKDGTNVWGVKLRKKDAGLLRTALEFILPNMLNETTYNRGSTNRNWPSIEALLNSMAAIVGFINEPLRSLAKVMPDLEDLIYPIDWSDMLPRLDEMRSEVLMVPAQNHETAQQPQQTTLQTPPGAAAMQQAQQTYQPPMTGVAQAPAAPSIHTREGKLDFQALMNGGQQPSYQAQGGYVPPYQQQQQPPQMFGSVPLGGSYSAPPVSTVPQSRDPRYQSMYSGQPMNMGNNFRI